MLKGFSTDCLATVVAKKDVLSLTMTFEMTFESHYWPAVDTELHARFLSFYTVNSGWYFWSVDLFSVVSEQIVHFSVVVKSALLQTKV